MSEFISRLFFFLAFFIVVTVSAQVQDSIPKIDLDNVIVKSAKINVNSKQVPFSVSIKNFNENRNYTSKSSLSDFTNSIPGLYASSSNNFSQDLRISIRGFGARSAFGIRGIKLIVDGIPETTPDGHDTNFLICSKWMIL